MNKKKLAVWLLPHHLYGKSPSNSRLNLVFLGTKNNLLIIATSVDKFCFQIVRR